MQMEHLYLLYLRYDQIQSESLLSRSLVPAAHELSSCDRFSIAVIVVRYTSGKPLGSKSRDPLDVFIARCLHARCNDIAFTDRRGHCGITITYHKLFTNTRFKPKAHTHEEEKRRDEARREGENRELRCTGNDSGQWVPGSRVKLQQINHVNHPAVGLDFSR